MSSVRTTPQLAARLGAPLAATALLLAAALAVPAAAHAQTPAKQTVVGRVLDRNTGRPVLGASVGVDKEDAVLTDTAGRFVLRGVPTGEHVVIIDQLGYTMATRLVDVEPGMEELVLPLDPNPVMLQAITIMADRFKNRRNAVATSVRAFDRSTLLTSASPTATEFVLTRAGLMRSSCDLGLSSLTGFGRNRLVSTMPGPFPGTGLYCVYVRGRAIEPLVYIDERPAFGLDELAMYRPDDLFLVEVYGGGSQIRAYTNWFVERSARIGLAPIPIF